MEGDHPHDTEHMGFDEDGHALLASEENDDTESLAYEAAALIEEEGKQQQEGVFERVEPSLESASQVLDADMSLLEDEGGSGNYSPTDGGSWDGVGVNHYWGVPTSVQRAAAESKQQSASGADVSSVLEELGPMEPDAVLSLYWNIDVGKMYRELEVHSQEPLACGVGVELGDALYVGGAGAGPKPGAAMPPPPPPPSLWGCSCTLGARLHPHYPQP